MEALTVSVGIERPMPEVYAFASVPENLPRWASGLGSSLERASDGTWIAETPEGRATVRFPEPNGLGVLDHTVILAPGVEIHVPLRVVATALLDRLLHHAVVVQIEGSSYRLRQHTDLVPEHIRSKALIQAPPVAPPPRRRGRPPKTGASHHAFG